MADKKDFYRQIHLKIDFGLNANQQVVQEEIPELVQHDNNSGLLVFDFYNNGRKVDLKDTHVLVSFQLPSGEGVYDEVTNIRPIESRAMYFTPMSVLSEVGTVHGNVALFKDSIQITSNVKFQLEVIKGISAEDVVDSDKYPILTTLINQVDTVVESARGWEQEFQNKYDEIEDVVDTAREEFTTQQEMFEQEFGDNLDTQERHFNEKSNSIDTRFEQKYQEINALFNQSDINAMFQEKFESLEQDYAQDYTDMKQTVREVYNTTLKYRIIEE